MPICRSGWILSGPLSSHRTVRLAIHSTSASRAARPHFHSWSFSSTQSWLNSGASMPCNLNVASPSSSVSPSLTMTRSVAWTEAIKIRPKQPAIRANVPSISISVGPLSVAHLGGWVQAENQPLPARRGRRVPGAASGLDHPHVQAIGRPAPQPGGDRVPDRWRGEFAYFELLRGRRHDRVVAPCALYLLEFNGRDLRSTPLEQRKRALAGLMGRRRPAAIEAKPRLECAFAGWRVMAEKTTAVQAAAAALAAHSLC